MDNSDPRYLQLFHGMGQLTDAQLEVVLRWPEEEICLDTHRYDAAHNAYWPLSIGAGVPGMPHEPSDKGVLDTLESLGYDPYPLKGVAGEFYREHRYRDLVQVINDLLERDDGEDHYC